jgi:hypothetical protein
MQARRACRAGRPGRAARRAGRRTNMAFQAGAGGGGAVAVCQYELVRRASSKRRPAPRPSQPPAPPRLRGQAVGRARRLRCAPPLRQRAARPARRAREPRGGRPGAQAEFTSRPAYEGARGEPGVSPGGGRACGIVLGPQTQGAPRPRARARGVGAPSPARRRPPPPSPRAHLAGRARLAARAPGGDRREASQVQRRRAVEVNLQRPHPGVWRFGGLAVWQFGGWRWGVDDRRGPGRKRPARVLLFQTPPPFKWQH